MRNTVIESFLTKNSKRDMRKIRGSCIRIKRKKDQNR